MATTAQAFDALRQIADEAMDRKNYPAFDFIRRHIKSTAVELASLHAECEALRFTRALAQARYENAVKLLTGIHDLLYPAPVNTPDGRTLVFRPDDTDLHAVLQLLSERIRAIPEELEAAHSSAWWTYRTESQRQRDAARAAKEQA